ncbi:MAG: hypothetical protein HY033_03405 [Ignavibacteriae bacterium]|nr:hypothetical protein [Ignavibacteria bacterium]MBI3363936.1 hypothetical protein [Ignavibacteriota bacterium]
MKLLIQVSLLVSLVTSSSFSQQAPWRRSPGLGSNPIVALDIYKKNPDTLYAIGNNTIRSTDRGEHWDTVYWYNTDVGAIRIDPNNSRVVYLSRFGFTIQGNDVLMSTDGGLHWRLLFLGYSYPVAVIEVDPEDSKTVYAGRGGPEKIYRTSNQGEHWDTLDAPVGASFLVSVAIAQTNDSIIYAGYSNGIFKSTDKGASWTRLSLGFPMQTGPALAVDSRNSEIVYAAIYTNDTTQQGGYTNPPMAV